MKNNFTPRSFSKKSIIIYIALVVLVLLVIGLFFRKTVYRSTYQPPSNQTQMAGWLTYKDSERGFEIRYPKDQQKPIVGVYDASDCDKPFYDFVGRGGVIDGPHLPYTKVTLKSLSEINTEGGLLGYKTTWTYSDSAKNKTFDLTLANFRNEETCTVAEIFLSNSEFSEEQNYRSPQVDQILSTFAFIDNKKEIADSKNPQASAFAGDEQKTYSNATYDFSFQYNDDWRVVENDKSHVALARSVSETNLQTPKDGDAWMDFGIVKSFYRSDGKTETDMAKWLDFLKKEYPNHVTTTVGGQPALRYGAEATIHSPGSLIYSFVKDGVGYTITIEYPKNSDGEGKKIVSTFKFTP